jgi:hypothetical protein
MSRALIVLNGKADRDKAQAWIRNAPTGTRVEFKASKRTLPQNDKLWASLTDLAQQLTWHGQKLKPEEWKLIMLSGLKKELRAVPNMDGTGFVNIGTSSSDLTKDEMSQLIELILAFGAGHGVQFKGG